MNKNTNKTLALDHSELHPVDFGLQGNIHIVFYNFSNAK